MLAVAARPDRAFIIAHRTRVIRICAGGSITGPQIPQISPQIAQITPIVPVRGGLHRVRSRFTIDLWHLCGLRIGR
jgi:hypothetical protein